MKKKLLTTFLTIFTLGFTALAFATGEEVENPLVFFETEGIDATQCDSEQNLTTANCDGNARLEYQHVGRDYGSWVFAKNNHPSKAISVTVRTRWVYQGREHEETKTYRLAPGERKHIGTTRWRNQVFRRDIVGCRFL